jgi:hypothetical protein
LAGFRDVRISYGKAGPAVLSVVSDWDDWICWKAARADSGVIRISASLCASFPLARDGAVAGPTGQGDIIIVVGLPTSPVHPPTMASLRQSLATAPRLARALRPAHLRPFSTSLTRLDPPPAKGSSLLSVCPPHLVLPRR